MRYDFKMKEATDKDEAITSILGVFKENPLWLNKCYSSLAVIIANCNPQLRKAVLQGAPGSVIIDLFVKLKTEYYNFKDNAVWS